MKKYQFVLLFVAALALLGCKSSSNGGSDDPDDPDPQFTSLIAVDDYTLDDWKTVPAEYLTKMIKAEDAILGGIDSAYVYADKVYLNLIVWINMDSLTKLDLIPLHIYLNADGDNKTGGYDDYFRDGNAEWMCEGYLFQSGQPVIFNPAVFMWWGANGGGISDQSNKTGWWWTDPATEPHDANDGYGAIIPTGSLPVASSQYIPEEKAFEIQVLREIITEDWATKGDGKFGLGLDLEMQVGERGTTDIPWVMLGVLPSTVMDEMGIMPIKPLKPTITIDPNDYE